MKKPCIICGRPTVRAFPVPGYGTHFVCSKHTETEQVLALTVRIMSEIRKQTRR